jgi:hypothetical protein
MKNYNFNKESDVKNIIGTTMKSYNLTNAKDIKDLAYHLKNNFSNKGYHIKHSEILDVISQSHGYKNWNTFSAKLNQKQNNNKYEDNYINIFNNGSTSSIVEFLSKQIFSDEDNNDMWKGRAISLISGVIKALVWQRDYQHKKITIQSISESLFLHNIHKTLEDKEIPIFAKSILHGYVLSLPGYQYGADIQQDIVGEQHGYIQMQFTRFLNEMKLSNNIFKEDM